MSPKVKFQALALASLLLLAFAGCASSPSPAGGGTTTGATGAGGATGAAVISASDKPLDVITNAMRAQMAAKSYRARMNLSSSNGSASTMLVEYVSPDRYRVVRDAGAGGADTKLEYLIVGKETYTRQGDGPWTKFPADMGGMISSFNDPKAIDELSKSAEIKFVGPDTLDGMPMLVYQHTLDNVGGLVGKSVTKTWVAVADGLPRKSESDGEFQGIKTKTVSTVSDYNSDIKIELPAK